MEDDHHGLAGVFHLLQTLRVGLPVDFLGPPAARRGRDCHREEEGEEEGDHCDCFHAHFLGVVVVFFLLFFSSFFDLIFFFHI